MSTPPGKSPSHTDLTADVSFKARERAVTERDPVEDGDHPPLSPYAPKQAHERASTELLAVENDDNPLRSPYAPKQARAQPSIEPDFVVSSGAEPLPSFGAPEGTREHPALERDAVPAAERDAIDVDEPRLCSDDAPDGRALGKPLSSERDGRDHSPKTAFKQGTREHRVDLDTPTSLQPAQASNSGWHEQPAAECRDETISDRDLERLEASLRSLQRQEAAMRLPRATPLPPVSGLPPLDARGRRHGGERFADGVRSPLSLVPERPVPPPMRSRHHNPRGPLCIFVASILAAPIVYYFSVGGLAPPSGSAPGPQIEAFVQRIIGSPWMSVGQRRPSPTRAQDDDPETSTPGEISSQQTETSQTARISEGATVAMSQPAATRAESPASSKAVRALDPEELKFLTRQGEQLASAGDLVTARILFQRAAEAGDATAAMALGATYDPNVLARLGVIGMGADVEKARSWYQRAESQGSAQATRQLQALANR
jgi:hypothetical protein